MNNFSLIDIILEEAELHRKSAFAEKDEVYKYFSKRRLIGEDFDKEYKENGYIFDEEGNYLPIVRTWRDLVKRGRAKETISVVGKTTFETI